MHFKFHAVPAAVFLLAAGAAGSASAACNITLSTNAAIAAFNAATVPAGQTVCIAAGTYTSQLAVVGPLKSTTSSWITITAANPASPPNLTGGLWVTKSAYVQLSLLNISQPVANTWSAVTLDNGTNHIKLTQSTVANSFAGISIGSSNGKAGAGIEISGNKVLTNRNFGIAAGDSSDGLSTDYQIIRGNYVSGNGGHGIDVDNTSYVLIDQNIVLGNGTGVNAARQGGYSGIHLYAPADSTSSSPGGKRCTGNVVRYNTVLGTQERPRLQGVSCDDGSGSGVCVDGNGIQVDHYCDGNDVSFNMASNNAGAGIAIYNGATNAIYNNSATGNNQQVGRVASDAGEIQVSAMTANRAYGNKIYRNFAQASVSGVPAYRETANAGSNTVGPNTWWVSRGATWAPVNYKGVDRWTSADVDTATGTVWNVVGSP